MGFRTGVSWDDISALIALAVDPGLNVGKAVLAGLVPAIHAAPPQVSRLLRPPSVQRLRTRLQCSRGWPGRARPRRKNRIRSPPTPSALRGYISLQKNRNTLKLALMNNPRAFAFQDWWFAAPRGEGGGQTAQKNFLPKIVYNPLISLVSDEIVRDLRNIKELPRG
jgi:hypothetical protein